MHADSQTHSKPSIALLVGSIPSATPSTCKPTSPPVLPYCPAGYLFLSRAQGWNLLSCHLADVILSPLNFSEFCTSLSSVFYSFVLFLFFFPFVPSSLIKVTRSYVFLNFTMLVKILRYFGPMKILLGKV